MEQKIPIPDPGIRAKRKPRVRLLIRGTSAALLIAFVVALVFFLRWERFKHNAEGLLRARIIETLQTRFQCRVALDEFHLKVSTDIVINGSGLRLYPNRSETSIGAETIASGNVNTPLIEVDSFSFRTNWQQLRKRPLHVDHVHVDGLHIKFPPRIPGRARFPLTFHAPEQRTQDERSPDPRRPDLRTQDQRSPAQKPPDPYDKHSGVSIVVDELDCTHASLIFATNKPGKVPLDFEISRLNLERVGGGLPLRFQASLVNPKPVGLIRSEGNFGPWNQEAPEDTPVSGVYRFDHADLGTFKGIGGMLSSTGNFDGVLNNIIVDGRTDTPDFRISVSGHPVALHADFHAVVDGTSGDTYLQPVNATFLHTHLIAAGKIVRVAELTGQGNKGHLIQLDVTVDRGRIEDLLMLGVRTRPPVMVGAVQLKTKFDLPPEHDIAVTDRLRLNGTFTVTNGHFENEKVRKKIDLLSKLGQGITRDSAESPPKNVASTINGHFSMASSRLTLSDLDYSVPGAQIAVNGVYSLDGDQFDFHGTARLHARLSQMTTGWKSLLLKPVDPFFARHGAGTEIPFKVSGTKSEPKIGLDFGHKDKSSSSRAKAMPPA